MTERNVPHALVDCNCETTVYSDGSGVEIHYCPLHKAAPEMLEVLQAIMSDDGTACRPSLAYRAMEVIKKAKGQ